MLYYKLYGVNYVVFTLYELNINLYIFSLDDSVLNNYLC